MTIRNVETGVLATDRYLGIRADQDEQPTGSADRILHLLSVDQCYEVQVDNNGGLAVIDFDGVDIGLRAAINHIHRIEDLEDGITREVEGRLRCIADFALIGDRG